MVKVVSWTTIGRGLTIYCSFSHRFFFITEHISWPALAIAGVCVVVLASFKISEITSRLNALPYHRFCALVRHIGLLVKPYFLQCILAFTIQIESRMSLR